MKQKSYFSCNLENLCFLWFFLFQLGRFSGSEIKVESHIHNTHKHTHNMQTRHNRENQLKKKDAVKNFVKNLRVSSDKTWHLRTFQIFVFLILRWSISSKSIEQDILIYLLYFFIKLIIPKTAFKLWHFFCLVTQG